MIFIKGDGKEIDLDLYAAWVVAVQKTGPLYLRQYHVYSILIGNPNGDSYFVSSKNYSRKAWSGVDTAERALLNLQIENLGKLCKDPAPIYVKKNTLECTWKTVKRMWVSDYKPGLNEHSLYYFYPRDEVSL